MEIAAGGNYGVMVFFTFACPARHRLKPADPRQRIITYCSGGIAATVNSMAHLMVGNENVAVYDGSLYEWIGEGLPVASKE